ncbi:MAG: conjugal transfer protein [Lachnospiraceae bacterium]|nr:conjugal transfer protein [Lachnospiraceae bacterium]
MIPMENWHECPICGNPHLLKYREDTVLINFPAYCKLCKHEVIITIEPKSRIESTSKNSKLFSNGFFYFPEEQKSI